MASSVKGFALLGLAAAVIFLAFPKDNPSKPDSAGIFEQGTIGFDLGNNDPLFAKLMQVDQANPSGTRGWIAGVADRSSGAYMRLTSEERAQWAITYARFLDHVRMNLPPEHQYVPYSKRAEMAFWYFYDMNPAPAFRNSGRWFQDIWINDALLDAEELNLRTHEQVGDINADEIRRADADISMVYRFYEDEDGKRQAEVGSFRSPKFNFGAAEQML